MPARLRTLVPIAAMLVFAVASATGTSGHPSLAKQTATQEKPAPQSSTDAAVRNGAVDVNVLVANDEGRAISGLREKNFRILDNGRPQTITHFSPTTAPITIAMVLEYSATGYDYYAAKSASWAAGFLDALEPRDWVALITYDLHSTVRSDFTHNRAEIRDAIGGLGFPAFREVSLYNGVMETLDRLEPVRGRKSILLLSTGSNSFSASSLDDVRKRLQSTDVTVFSVGLAEEEYVRSGGSSIAYLQGRTSLQSFSDLTGGVAYFPRFPAELPDIFRGVAGFLRSEYTLQFVPPPELRDGKPHRITVQVVGSDGKPLGERDKKGRERKFTVYARHGYRLPAAAQRSSGNAAPAVNR